MIIVINIVIIDPDQVISSVAIGGELLPRFKENLEKVPINDHWVHIFEYRHKLVIIHMHEGNLNKILIIFSKLLHNLVRRLALWSIPGDDSDHDHDGDDSAYDHDGDDRGGDHDLDDHDKLLHNLLHGRTYPHSFRCYLQEICFARKTL